ncbi:MAG: glycosyltransferase [Dysgonamonadaceae bacterium]|jgi:glycosyltransferase involved in cell wall biosynthesis|nr:glycosyltransferase [Dysgonamonadaceae bacterium]
MRASICIPAYKRADVLKRALDSVFEQDFSDFEVIVTDDSPDDSVENLVRSYPEGSIHYFRNQKRLGSSENWNEGIRKAQGEYIKILHHDDWFASPQSLRLFVGMLDENPDVNIAFSGSCDIHPNDIKPHVMNERMRARIAAEPEYLFHGNKIGAPDVCIFRNKRNLFFDSGLVWLVDVDFYIRMLKQNPVFGYTEEILINIGISSEQITQSCLADSVLQIKETFYLYHKLNPDKKRYSYRKTILRLLGRSKIFNTNDLRKILPDDKTKLSAIDGFWARYFYSKKQIRSFLAQLCGSILHARVRPYHTGV